MMKTSSGDDISVACSIVLSDNKNSLGMVKDKSKYGILTLTKNGLLQLQFLSKLVLSYNVTDLSSIFDRFINEGKTTLRFKKAAQDVMLQSKDTDGLKRFIKALKYLKNISSKNGGQISVLGHSKAPKQEAKQEAGNEENTGSTSKLQHHNSEIKPNSENRKRPVLSVNSSEQSLSVPLKRRQTIAVPAVLKKSETFHGKVLKRLSEGTSYVTSLSCEKCRLLSFSRCDELSNLAALELIECGLSKVPQELGMIPNLKNLNLARNRISLIDAQLLASLRKLTNLDLSSNRIAWLPISVADLKFLKGLFLQNNQIRIINALPPCLVQLDVSKNPLNTIWVNKLTKFFGDVDISGLITPNDEDGTSFISLREVPANPLMFAAEVPSLFEFSARSTIKNWLSVHWKYLPPVIIASLQMECLCCICNQITLQPAIVKRCALVHMGWRSQMTDMTSLMINFLSVKCQICASRRAITSSHSAGVAHRISLA